jgi:hypothetical protein
MWFQPGERAMRRTVFALTVLFLAPTAAMASVAGGELVGNSELGAAAAVIQKHQTAPGGGAIGQRGPSGGNIILAKGDQSGNGPGLGGQKGQKKGGNKGKQAEGKDNPNKQRGRGNPNSQQGRGRS